MSCCDFWDATSSLSLSPSFTSWLPSVIMNVPPIKLRLDKPTETEGLVIGKGFREYVKRFLEQCYIRCRNACI